MFADQPPVRRSFTVDEMADFVKALPPSVPTSARADVKWPGPLSDETGGPLSGAEAERVLTGKSIRFLGYLWEGGQVVCKPCSRKLVAQPPGWRFVLYEGDNVAGFRCMCCNGIIGP